MSYVPIRWVNQFDQVYQLQCNAPKKYVPLIGNALPLKNDQPKDLTV